MPANQAVAMCYDIARRAGRSVPKKEDIDGELKTFGGEVFMEAFELRRKEKGMTKKMAEIDELPDAIPQAGAIAGQYDEFPPLPETEKPMTREEELEDLFPMKLPG